MKEVLDNCGAFQTKKRVNLGKGPKGWDFFELGTFLKWPPKIISKQVEYEKYWYKISQYEWYNGIFGHV